MATQTTLLTKPMDPWAQPYIKNELLAMLTHVITHEGMLTHGWTSLHQTPDWSSKQNDANFHFEVNIQTKDTLISIASQKFLHVFF